MVEICVRRRTTAPATATAVLDTLRETSPERRRAFGSNVTPRYSKLHASGPDFLEVTEGTFIVSTCLRSSGGGI